MFFINPKTRKKILKKYPLLKVLENIFSKKIRFGCPGKIFFEISRFKGLCKFFFKKSLLEELEKKILKNSL